MPDYCGRPLPSRSRYKTETYPRCNNRPDHQGPCSEFPYLSALRIADPKVAKKVERDAMMTTGASWKSSDAGPNRIVRYAMLLSDEELAALGVNMADLEPIVVAKLREKAASYDDCIGVSLELTRQVYSMPDAPNAPPDTLQLITELSGNSVEPATTVCLVCRRPLSFNLFALARRGKAEIETAHALPRLHSATNVGFAHRDCNIAQGSRSLPEFHLWIAEILASNGWETIPPKD